VGRRESEEVRKKERKGERRSGKGNEQPKEGRRRRK
jgi:hypothetical protein